MVSIAKENALDEIVWCDPKFIHDHGPLHNNTVLMYFADSPWCDPTSNNRVIMAQSFFNANLANIVATRETFEERLRSMSGLEYIVSEAPEETGPGMGTGVWVIKKQTRKKRNGQEDELTVHALYYIIGQNIYPAPSLMDTMSSKMVSDASHNCIRGKANTQYSQGFRHPYPTRLEAYLRLQIAYRNGLPLVATPL